MNTTTSTRPFNLPPELPEPPNPPVGHRGVYRGAEWKSEKGVLFSYCNHGRWFFEPLMRIAGDGSGHYIEYIPLRPTPEGVADVPEGFEYYDGKRTPGGFNYGDVMIHNGSEWVGTSCLGVHAPALCAFKIGSEIHSRHFDAAPVDSNPVAVETSSPGSSENYAGVPVRKSDPTVSGEEKIIAPQPAKAREWVLRPHAMGVCAVVHYGPVPEPKEEIHVREVTPNEQALLEEALDVIKDLRDERCVFTESKADAFIKKYGPAPAPEPAFDLAAFWEMMPPWIMYRAMERDKTWVCFAAEPTNWEIKFWAAQGDGIRYVIPPEFAPPAAADWKSSLAERPKA